MLSPRDLQSFAKIAGATTRVLSPAFGGNVEAAFAKRVEGPQTMTPATKQEARKKVEQIVVGVGYHDDLCSQPFALGLSEHAQGASARRAAQLVLVRLE
jgi:predicted metalloendopeptidase